MEVPESLQLWFIDDAGAAGRARDNVRCLDFLVKNRPKYGYYPEVKKSYCICKLKDIAVTQAEFDRLCLYIKMSQGRNYLGGFIGGAETKADWLQTYVKRRSKRSVHWIE